jgi:hypothetical protein
MPAAATVWTEAQVDHSKMKQHMADLGVLQEAAQLFDRMDAGTDASTTMPAADVREWLSKYLHR